MKRIKSSSMVFKETITELFRKLDSYSEDREGRYVSFTTYELVNYNRLQLLSVLLGTVKIEVKPEGTSYSDGCSTCGDIDGVETWVEIEASDVVFPNDQNG